MWLSTSISCMMRVQTRCAMAMFWRWQSGEAAAREESSFCSAFARDPMQGLAKEGSGQLKFEPEADKYFFKIWETHKKASSTTNTSEDNQQLNNVLKEEHAHPHPQIKDCHARIMRSPHQPAPCPPAVFLHHSKPFPIHRIWRSAPHTTHTPSEKCFVITSFNILASAHAKNHKNLYLSVPTGLLDWSTRRKKVLQELDRCSPDIICLQEVDKFEDLEEDLASRGYSGLYKIRTGEMPDGCAIFWRKARFQLLQERSFEFSMLGMRNNVAQLCVLQLIVPGLANSRSGSVLRTEEQTQGHLLVVGNIHVLFNPKRGEIKLGQCRAFLEQVHNISNIWHGAPVVIGGDFNSTPSSAVYKYLATSELDLSGLDRRYVSGLGAEALYANKYKSGKDVQSRTRLKEVSTGCSIAELASQEKAGEPALSTLDESVSSMPSLCVSYTEQFEMDMHSTPSLESIFKEQSAAFNQTDPCGSLNGGNRKDLAIQQILGNGWGLEELRVATGRTDCTLMQHELNLFSAYPDIEGHSHTRDAQGEPLLTTCHTGFSGTVDYIWRTDGLKTIKVLDTVPVTTFARNKNLPLMMWGSDHLALACELAFT